ncbi:hypothetical protein [Bacillus bombysepticus]|uniref:hypothetical protein n=1 Tax=Bacillus bombysepticus TaxID=658666 RepID=UPI00301814EE
MFDEIKKLFANAETWVADENFEKLTFFMEEQKRLLDDVLKSSISIEEKREVFQWAEKGNASLLNMSEQNQKNYGEILYSEQKTSKAIKGYRW